MSELYVDYPFIYYFKLFLRTKCHNILFFCTFADEIILLKYINQIYGKGIVAWYIVAF